jgi:NADPH-dependent glutamate synthase beta subunit-like oxidoreductase/2,4-dienoyl-CoA reductase-like NADH-dependent reductase (Old Yellow Enzyme family)
MLGKHDRFHYKKVEELQEELANLNLRLPFDTNVSNLGDQVRNGRFSVPNRLVAQPMEGFDATTDGTPQELTLRRYVRYARGGVGLIWFEATAVLAEARSNPGQMYIHKENADAFKRLVADVKEAAQRACGRDVVMVMQLTHSGRYSKPAGIPAPIIAQRSAVLDPRHNLGSDYPTVSDAYLDKLQDRYVEAARMAAAAGFDGIDLKSCHGYLLSEILASYTRPGKYGGSFENRTRMLRETLTRISQDVPQVFTATRLNAFDAYRYPYGWGVDKSDCLKPDLSEPLALIGILEEIGISVVNISIGNPYYNPHVGRPYDFPIKGVDVPDEHPLLGLVRFVDIYSAIQKKYPRLPVVGSGLGWLREFMPQVAAGLVREGSATLIGQGRGMFAYPDSVNDILTKGKMDPAKCCVTCSACTQIMRDGGRTGCVVRDKEIYGPEYRLARRFSLDRLLAEAARCRNCTQPTCGEACPAHVDVPGFIKAFSHNDIREAYGILRKSNVLPEMCASVCPADEQCQGGCLEKIFCLNPISVADIQLVVARSARLQGITGVAVPDRSSGKSIGIVGGGPAGIACAVRLIEMGHCVTIYEKSGALGGTPSNIIPLYRYGEASSEVNAILNPAIDKKRCSVQFNTALGATISLADIRERHDALVLAMGLDANGDKREGVIDALSFLSQAKKGKLPSLPASVAVVGGGNTAIDAATTAKKLGVRDVYLVYRRSFGQMPAWKSEREGLLDAGVHLMILTQPAGYISENGELKGLKIERTRLGEPDASGRRRPEVLPGTGSVLDVGLVIEATGQRLSSDVIGALGAVAVSRDGLIVADPVTFATNAKGMFAAGDCVSGGETAVRGVAEGMKAAESVNAYLAR